MEETETTIIGNLLNALPEPDVWGSRTLPIMIIIFLVALLNR